MYGYKLVTNWQISQKYINQSENIAKVLGRLLVSVSLSHTVYTFAEAPLSGLGD